MSDILQNILNSSFIENLFKIIMGILVGIVKLILYPVGLLVKQFMPDLDGALSQIGDYFDIVLHYIGWATSALGIPSIVIVMIVGYYTFVLSTTIATWGIKLVVKWKNALI